MRNKRNSVAGLLRYVLPVCMVMLLSTLGFAEQDCIPVDREYGDWEFVCAIPTGQDATYGQGGTGTNVIVPGYLWKREFTIIYQCCNGEKGIRIPVGGNWQYWQRAPQGIVAEDGKAWRSVPDTPPTPQQITDMKRAHTPPIPGWWQTPPGQNEAGPAPTDAELGIKPVEWPSPPIVPRAQCGEWVKIGDLTKPWSEFGKKATKITPAPPSEPINPWPAEYADCCSKLKPEQLKPVIRARHAYFKKEAGNTYTYLELVVSHVCGVKEGPLVEEYVLASGRRIRVPKNPARFRSRHYGSGSNEHWVISWDRQQIARKIFASDTVGLIAVVKATSNCGVTTVESIPILMKHP